MTLRTWARRIGLGLVAGGSVAALLALTGAPQAAPQLEWTHSGTSVTHFECFVDGAYAGNLGKPEPVGNAYSANLSLCGQITAGQHTLSVKACNYTNCTDTGTSLALVVLGTIGTGTEACVGPAQDDVQSAVNAATYGDKVQVCAGSATWTVKSQGCATSTALCMTKGIYLVGGIGGTTTITLAGTDPGDAAILYSPDAASRTNDTAFTFSGFTVDGGGIYWNNGQVGVRNTGSSAISNIVLSHNTFTHGRTMTKVMYMNGPVYGVAHHNTFVDTYAPLRLMGGNKVGWELNHQAYGTGNNFFFEDNSFSFTPGNTVDWGGTSNGQGAPGMVVRYNSHNLSNMTGSGSEWMDHHGLQGMAGPNNTTCATAPLCLEGTVSTPCHTHDSAGTPCSDSWSQVKAEIYGNSWTNLSVAAAWNGWVIHRGAWMLMFNNDITGTYAGAYHPIPKYREYACDSAQNPATPVYSQHIQNTYVFNNRYNSTDQPLLPITPRTNHNAYESADYCADGVEGGYEITENVDYFNLDATFDGTTGIGCGTLANLPATCTTGVGYWATNQSCSDMTGMIGAAPSTPISGTLYKCTATDTWEAYYTPYTYPHPKAATPAAASSLRVK